MSPRRVGSATEEWRQGAVRPTDDAMLSMALHRRDQNTSLLDIAARPDIT
ncbi:hypothetical protein M878_07625 [Streptomyces roseochromogenus subsp. oscitans DS 12.976]|uniref:Uncharacterized protein n=1 Tax=Streptomyces roseochromogenus subsp. oscitans DS 12.976 TaxID=1352936 RepID=V6KUI8_STRRC|nr:hypothetical protein M878_07625 [Streptomyces roseochromogenus subsp. oscitans DS 12.976]